MVCTRTLTYLFGVKYATLPRSIDTVIKARVPTWLMHARSRELRGWRAHGPLAHIGDSE